MALERLGEVVEASTGQFLAQAYQLHCPPPLGAWVKTREGEVEIYAVVEEARTEGIDPGRRPVARGHDEEDDAAIYRKNPQLVHLLRTLFQARVVAHAQEGDLRPYLPPRPAVVHAFVHACPPEETARLTTVLDFLSVMARGDNDETLAACLRQASLAHPDAPAFLLRAGKELAWLFAGEPSRLDALLRRLRP